MPFVQRDDNGAITGLFANPQDFASEYLPDNDASVIAFLTPPAPVIEVAQPAQAALASNADIGQVIGAVNALATRVAALEARAG